MAYRQLKKEPNLRGIAASAVANGEVTNRGTHYATFLQCLDSNGVPLTRTEILADLGDIVVRINGEQYVDATADLLLDLQKFYGDADNAGNVDGIVPIYWERPKLATFQERSIFALGSENMDSFTIDAKVDAVNVLSSIEVFSQVTPERRRIGQHVRISKFPQSFASTGVQEITTLPKEGDDVAYLAMHIQIPSGSDITEVTCKLGGNDIFDEVSDELNQVLLERSGRVPQSGYFHVSFDMSNDIAGMIPMAGVKDWRQQITWATQAPSNFNIFTERIFGLNVRK